VVLLGGARSVDQALEDAAHRLLQSGSSGAQTVEQRRFVSGQIGSPGGAWFRPEDLRTRSATSDEAIVTASIRDVGIERGRPRSGCHTE
jgi:hypothetical protein